MGRQGVCPRYMQPTESSRLRVGGKVDEKAAHKPKRVMPKPRIVKKIEDLGTRSVKKADPKTGKKKQGVQEKKGRPCLAKTSIPKAPMKPVDLNKPTSRPVFGTVSNLKKPSAVSNLKKAAARVIPAKVRAAGKDTSMKTMDRIRTIASKLPTFSKTPSFQKSKIKAPSHAPFPKMSKIPKAPTKTPKATNSRLMTRAERRHYKLWEGMTKTNQQAFGAREISGIAAVRC